MRTTLLERKNALSTVVITAVLAASLVQAVIRSDGFQESRISLNNGSVWVTNNAYVGRLNLESRKIEVRLKDPKVSSADGFELIQSGAEVATVGSGSIRPIVDATATFEPSVEIAGATSVGLGGIVYDTTEVPLVVAADETSGKVWSSPADQWAAVDRSMKPTTVVEGGREEKPKAGTEPADGEATDGEASDDGATDAGSAAKVAKLVLAVGSEGTAHLHRAGTDEIVQVTPAGTPVSRGLDRAVAHAAITSVGTTTVLLDESAQELLLAGGRTIDLAELGGGAVLQQPGPARSSVLVATESGLWDVPLDGGSPTNRVRDGGARPVAPVWVENAKGSCAFGAWSGSARWGRWCNGLDDVAKAEPLAAHSKKLVGGNPMVFRVNHGRAVLNDVQSGANLLVDLPEPVVVDDWDQAEDREKTDEEQEEKRDEKDAKSCSDDPPAPVTKADEAGTREGIPVIVPVLDNDQADPCDVLTIKPYEPADLKAIDGATVTIVDDGAALQVAPAPDRRDAVTVPYTAVGKGGESSGVLTVSIVPDDVNHDPEAVPDETVVTAGSLDGVEHNVLLNDSDPDGDALTLVSVVETNATSDAMPRFQANGAITYEAPGDSLAPVKLTYRVVDGRGGEAESTLTIRVRAPGGNSAPTPRPDRATAFVGRTTKANVLRNDSDPDGDPLSVVSLGDGKDDVNATVADDGTVTFAEPPSAGRFVIEVTVTDGQETATADLVVTVLAPDGNLAPIAVRDDVVARPGVPALVDLLANDLDPEGDLLAVTEVVPPQAAAGQEIAVELLEMRVARVTVPPSLTRPAVVRYVISDGVNRADGVLVVRPLFESAPDLAPIAKPDSVRVKAGGTATVSVLRNDVDPEGEQLTITDVSVLDESHGLALIQGDQVRIRPTAGTRGTMLVNYVVKDPSGNPADALVTVTVLDPASPNTPPRSPSVEGRVFSGGQVLIPVPLLDLDPDGDAVHLVGLDPTMPPRLGTVTFTKEGIEYRSYAGMTGADRFRFEVSDGKRSTVGTARVVVVERPKGNTPPIAVPDRVRVRAGGERVIPVLLNDVDLDEGDELSLKDDDVEGLVPPRAGDGTAELTEDRTEIRYRAPSDIGGKAVTVSFTYGVTDGLAVSRGLVVVEVTPEAMPEPPVARDDAMTPQLAGRTVEVDVLANDDDPDGDKKDLELRVLDDPDATNVGNGILRVKLGKAAKQFAYEITDGDGLSARALVTIPVVTEEPLVVETGEIEIEGGKERKIDVAQWANAEVRLEQVFEQTVHGLEPKGRISGSTVTMRAKPDWKGEAGFSYLVTSGERQAVGAVRVRITGLKVKPEVSDQQLEIPEGGSRDIDLRRLVTDPDSSTHTFKLDGGVLAGKVDAELAGSRLVITAGDTAKDARTTLTVLVSDGDFDVPLAIEVAVVKTDVAPPIAVADTAQTDEDVATDPLDVLRNDVSAAKGDLALAGRPQVQGGASQGSARYAGDELVFTPAKGFYGVARIAYTIEDVHKQTAVGMVEVTVRGRPGKPSAPTGTAENGLVRIQWQAPNRGGIPVTGFVVRDEVTGKTYSSPSTSYTVTGLTNGTPHRFRVAALNDVVRSEGDVRADEWSNPSPQLTPDAAPPQMAAPQVKFDKADNNGGTGGVLWVQFVKPPAFEGSPVKAYRLTYTGGGVGNGERSLKPGDEKKWHKIDGLTNGVTYSFTIAAQNAAGENSTLGGDGWGPTSAANTEFPAGLPGAPSGVTASRAADQAYAQAGGAAIVSWNPGTDGGDGQNLAYEVQSIQPTGRSFTSKKNYPDAPTMRETAAPLDPNVVYQFKVRAENKAGLSEWSAPTRGVNVAARPSVDPANMVPGNREVQFSNIGGNLGGAGVGQYEVNLNGWRPVGASGTSGSVGANNGTRYDNVQIRLCNTSLVGQGEDKDSIACSAPKPVTNRANSNANWVMPFGQPDLSAVVSGGDITWTAATVEGNTISFSGDGSSCGAVCRRASPGFNSAELCATATSSGQGVTSQPSPRVCKQTAKSSISGFSRGNPGSSNIGTCTSGAGCNWVGVGVRNFNPGTYTVVCYPDEDGDNRDETGLYTYGQNVSAGDSTFESKCLAGQNVGQVDIAIVVPGLGIIKHYQNM